MHWDLFISHASEDKTAIATPLAEELAARGLRVWFDKFVLRPGESLRQNIENGLSQSQLGVVVVSHAFFKKKWTQQELNGLSSLGRRLIPVWHEIEAWEVAEAAPMFADLIALNTADGLGTVVDGIVEMFPKLGLSVSQRRERDLRISRHIRELGGSEMDVINASNALGSMGPAAAPALPVLCSLLSSLNWCCAEHAAKAIRRIGVSDGASLTCLIEALESDSWMVRAECLRALGRLGRNSQALVRKIEPMLKDKSEYVRVEAQEAISIISARPRISSSELWSPRQMTVEPLLVNQSLRLEVLIHRVLNAATALDPWSFSVEDIREIARYGEQGASAVPCLLRFIDAMMGRTNGWGSWYDKWLVCAFDALMNIGKGVETVVPSLVGYLKSAVRLRKEWWWRRGDDVIVAIAKILPVIGPAARVAIPQVKRTITAFKESDLVVQALQNSLIELNKLESTKAKEKKARTKPIGRPKAPIPSARRTRGNTGKKR